MFSLQQNWRIREQSRLCLEARGYAEVERGERRGKGGRGGTFSVYTYE
jgi:hypothetical protein